MEISNEQVYNYFCQYYGQVNCWPIPYDYSVWYQTLSQQYQSLYARPQQYIRVYQLTLHHAKSQIKQQNSKKLSRGQKRRLKKQQLQAQYDSEKKLIGKWVQKQRKDLIISLNKIQQQQKRIKQKKQEKLSHLIQIHKQVRKHHLKKRGQHFNEKQQKKGRVKNKKKRMSYIKKMKIIYESKVQKFNNQQKVLQKPSKQQNKQNKQNTQNQQKLKQKIKPKYIQEQDLQNFPKLIDQKLAISKYEQQDQYMTESDQQMEQQAKQQKNKQLVENKICEIKAPSFPIQQIKYNVVGKLTGIQYKGFYLREWVTNMPSASLQEISLTLINRLAYKQAIKKVNKPQKAKKLIVSGVHQCKRTLTTFLQNKRSKMIFIALNIQRNNLTKGIDDEIQSCIQESKKIKIPIIHVSTRARLGRAFTGKFGPRATIISIINFEGYQDMVQTLKYNFDQACRQYQKK